jgi:hypothetical protein
VGVALAVTLVCAGCATLGTRASTGGEQTRIDASKVKLRDDIVQIVQFWNQPYWLQDSERVKGFKVTVYFVSGETEKGVFVPGKILVWVYELTPTERGRYERKLVYGWEFDQAEAMAMRVNKLAVGGYFYGFPLQWPPDVSLEGKHIEIQFGYERVADKQVILSSPRRFRVPIPLEYLPPEQKTEP